MHPNPAFRGESRARNIEFARQRGFGVLAVVTGDTPALSHIPFLLTEDGAVADLHLVRSNPIVRLLKSPVKATIAVSGPDSYVSPDWYGSDDQVPTWNYVAVHLSGKLELRPQVDIDDLLDRQSALFEQRLLPKRPWKTGKMDRDVLDRMKRMIVPCRLVVDNIEGTWKLNQNKPDAARISAAEHVAAAGIGAETQALARLMKGF